MDGFFLLDQIVKHPVMGRELFGFFVFGIFSFRDL